MLIFEYDIEKYINSQKNKCYKRKNTIDKKNNENLEILQICTLCIASKLVDFKPLQLTDFSYGKTKLINYERFILELTKYKIETLTLLDAYYEKNHTSAVIIDKHWDLIYQHITTYITYNNSLALLNKF
jgi:hypothetical protein